MLQGATMQQLQQVQVQSQGTPITVNAPTTYSCLRLLIDFCYDSLWGLKNILNDHSCDQVAFSE